MARTMPTRKVMETNLTVPFLKTNQSVYFTVFSIEMIVLCTTIFILYSTIPIKMRKLYVKLN